MQIKLQNFEGPIELLYNLIDERKLDISQISLANVTDQYLSYIKHFQQIDPKNLAEFLVIAARLILIKSKTLLPTLELTGEESEEMNDLQKKLELYKKLREATKILRNFYRKSSPTFSREFLAFQQTIFLPPKDITKHSLKNHLQNLIVKIPKPISLPEKTLKIVISFEEVIKNLHHRITNAIHKTFSQAIGSTSSKIEIIMHFLALLELVKQKHVIANQNEIFGEISLAKFDSVNKN
ncbi:MAG: Segregation and condensation protein A [Candidatus Moranbacteria bacterium GW2011_GWF2_37_7]|nr:MAG: Segregation and condensation protein A [Candidatus Moranbacteria bacterium GW2011_GWF2_37_7]